MSAWNGLGITAGVPDGTWTEFLTLDTAAVMAPFIPGINKFPRLRMVGEYSSDNARAGLKLWATALKAYKPTQFIMFGLANSDSVYLPAFYSTYLSTLLVDAQWAQDNLMDQFQIANEFEISSQRGTLSITSIERASNVSTVVTASAHGLSNNDTVIITGASPSSFNVSQVAITVVNETTFTYANTGVDESASGTMLLKCGDATIIRFVKMLAVEAQAVFTRGPITYSVSQGYQTYWTSITPGTDLDLIGLDAYGSNSFDEFASMISTMFGVFGTQMIVSEFNLNASWSAVVHKGMTPASNGFDIAYADEMYRRLKYIQGLGIEQAYAFTSWWGATTQHNNFSIFYDLNPGNTRIKGNYKSAYDRLLEQRISHVFFGSQLT